MPLPANEQLESVFGADGALSRAIPGFRMRRQQIEMAQAILGVKLDWEKAQAANGGARPSNEQVAAAR